MISFNEYFDLLDKQRTIIDYYNEMFEEQAENSRFQRNKKIHKKYLKDIEHRRAIGLNIFDVLFRKELKKKGAKVSAVKVNQKEGKIKQFFKKLFGIKPKEIECSIEQIEEKSTFSKENAEKEEIQAEATSVETVEDEELDDYGDVEYTEEELDSLYPDEVEGQMDIEELNEGDVYEK